MEKVWSVALSKSTTKRRSCSGVSLGAFCPAGGPRSMVALSALASASALLSRSSRSCFRRALTASDTAMRATRSPQALLRPRDVHLPLLTVLPERPLPRLRVRADLALPRLRDLPLPLARLRRLRPALALLRRTLRGGARRRRLRRLLAPPRQGLRELLAPLLQVPLELPLPLLQGRGAASTRRGAAPSRGAALTRATPRGAAPP